MIFKIVIIIIITFMAARESSNEQCVILRDLLNREIFYIFPNICRA